MALPLRRRGPLLPARLLPPDHRRRRPPGARLRHLDPQRLPLRRVVDRLGEPLLVPVELPGRIVHAAVWLAQVGRVPLLLLDTDVPENDERDRPITPHPLRARPRDAPPPGARPGHRRRARPARAGHRAVGLASQRGPLRVHARGAGPRADGGRRQPGGGLRAASADRPCSPSTRPVPAGNERFAADLVRRLAAPALAHSGPGPRGRPGDGPAGGRRRRPVRHDGLLAAQHVRPPTASASCTRTPPTRPGRASSSQPILGITNGVHPPTWVGEPMREVFSEIGGDLDHLEDEYEADRFWERLDERPRRAPLGGAPRAEAAPPGVRPGAPAATAGPPRRGALASSRRSRTSSTRTC